jgi:pyruvate ferredoxin oxidoreductase alpha subunit
MRLPVVITCANRGVSAPITIWNDHQDVMTIRDAGWVLLFAENHQEAVEQHLLAYKIAEQMKLPVMVNIDGFVLTHTYESVVLPTREQVKKFLPDYKPAKGEYLDIDNPVTLGSFAAPAYYFEIRQELHNDLLKCQKILNDEYKKLKMAIPEIIKTPEKNAIINNALVEYYGPKNPKIVLIALGSLIGTIKDAVDETNKKFSFNDVVGILKIKCLRPFPEEEILKVLKNAKYAAVIEKAVSLGASDGPLTLEIKDALYDKAKTKIKCFIVGLGGRDITKQTIKDIIVDVKSTDDKMEFVGKV